MEKSGRAEQIIAQAHQWNFEGDCTLLSWMKELSENLEQRVTTSSESLRQLGVNVNRTAIALDNAANSLTALQYTQFVESRCHDDDETIANVAEVPVAAANAKEQTKTPNEILRTFLSKNLEMLHKCHEKYEIEEVDSDDETATNNCIYQPKNPYNDNLLPHIYGSKLWNEHWHVGLCDGTNEYSGDESSEAFSESSTSVEDNESYESNTANLSEWASSTSITNDNKYPSHIAVQNVSAFNETIRKPHLPATTYAAGSDTSSTISRATTDNRLLSQEHNVFSTQQDTSPTSNSSSSSVQQSSGVLSSQSHLIGANNVHKNLIMPPLYDITPPDDIFAEANTSVVNQNTANTASTQIRRKPVNLFDDDDFNSFMTEIVEKAEAKADTKAEVAVPVPAARTLPTKTTVPATLPRKAVVDLFNEAHNDVLNANETQKMQGTQPTVIEIPKDVVRKPVNLFESPTVSPTNESLFPESSTIKNAEKNTENYAAKSKITPKSLFDDDDDDDFLNVFSTRKINVSNPSGRTLLFDDADDIEKEKAVEKKPTTKIVDLFADISEENITENKTVKLPKTTKKYDLFSDEFEQENEGIGIHETVDNINSIETNAPNSITSTDKVLAEADKPVANIEARQIEGARTNNINKQFDMKLNANKNQTDSSKAGEIIEKVKPTNLFGVNLFGDMDEDDDLFSKKPTLTQDKLNKNVLHSARDELPSTKVVPASKRKSEEEEAVKTVPEATSKPLFPDEDSDNDDLFQRPVTKHIPHAAKEKPKTAVNEGIIMANNLSPVLVKTSSTNEPFLKEDNDDNGSFDTHSTNNFSKVPTDSNNGVTTTTIKHSSDKLDSNFTSSCEPEDINTQSRNNQESGNSSSKLEICKTSTSDETASNETANIAKRNSIERTVLSSEEPLAECSIAGNADVAVVKEITIADKQDIQNVDISKEQTNIPVSMDQATSTEVFPTTSDIKDTSNDSSTTQSATVEALSEITSPEMSNARVVETNKTAHNYTGIFLDEPPDDDDFFQTLSVNQQSTSKFALDLEHDFYEPALPTPPTTIQSEMNKADISNISSDYSGLRLFSEVPPDDDGQQFESDIPKSSEISQNHSQRLHSVFYDDFNETMEAMQRINEQKMPIHSLFDDEPPPDDKFGMFEKLTEDNKKKLGVMEELPVPSNVPIREKAEEYISTKGLPEKVVTDEPDRGIEKRTVDIEKPRNTTGISKLQLPNIKINVQALLPGAEGRPNFRKLSKETKTDETPAPIAVADSPIAVTSKNTTTTTSENSNENILTNVCKTRVRAPAKRRPSTRRGRQENYRNSLLAEDAALYAQDAIGTEAPTISTLSAQNISEKISPKEQTTINTNESKATLSSGIAFTKPVENVEKVVRKPATNLFFDNVDVEDDNSLFSSKKPGSVEVIDNTTPAKSVLSETVKPESVAVQRKTDNYANSTLFADSDGNDDDLFEPINISKKSGKTAGETLLTKNAMTSAHHQPPTNISSQPPPLKSIFADEQTDSDDDLFKNSSIGNKKKPTNNAEKKNIEKSASKKLDSLFDSDEEVDDFLSSLKKAEKPQASVVTSKKNKSAAGAVGGLFSDIDSDEDELFGGQQKLSKAIKKPSESINKMQSNPLTTPQLSATSASAKSTKSTTVADNPLADLLNS